MNTLDRQYQSLLQDILDNGVEKNTRNGKVLSVFGKQIRHNMKEGFPLLTTKKMYWKGIVTELLWFLRGDTNIKYLVDNDCHIWDGDCFSNYCKKYWDLDERSKIEYGSSFYIREANEYNFETYPKEEFINKIKTDNEFAEKWGELGPIYGKQWRSWGSNIIDELGNVYTNEVDYDIQKGKLPNGSSNRKFVIDELKKYNPRIDQIANLINDLKTNPDSRRLMVNAWNVGELDQMVLPPCHYGFQVYTRELTWEEQVQWVMKNTNVEWENVYIVEEIAKPSTPKRAISLMWNQRSVDTFLGLPFNIASYSLLLCILAELTDMVPDQLIGSLGDVHLYQNHWNQANEQISRTPFDLPTLRINTEFWNPENTLGDNWDAIIKGMEIDDFQIENYQSHPSIKAPLSN